MVLTVYAPEKPEQGRQLADRLGVPMTDSPDAPLYLRLDDQGLTLVGGKLELRGDFTGLLPRLKPNNLQGEMLCKAAKLKNFPGTPVAVDATAGMGEDAFLLAASGFTVHLFEYDPVIAALLSDALERAKQDPVLGPIAARMTLHPEDSIQALQDLPFLPDVVVLDPMFPARQKSGLIKKKFQLLQQLERPCGDEEALLAAAIAAKPRKIVIKRPAKGPNLAGKKPSYSLDGKAIRYDCLVLPRSGE
jgi:16S rRNA (guanine1516-N2)-methyltransferase